MQSLALRYISMSLDNTFVYDTEFKANVIDVADALGYARPADSDIKLKEANNLMVYLKAQGIWAKLDTFAMFSWNDTAYANLARIDWKRNNTLYTLTGTVTYTTSGYKPDGSSGYIDSNYSPSTQATHYLQNDASINFTVYENISVGTYSTGLNGGTSNAMRHNAGIQYRINQGTANNNATLNFGGTGFRSMHRTSSSGGYAIIGATQTTTVATSSAIGAGTQWFGRGTNAYSSLGFSHVMMGGSLTYTETQNFRTAYNTFLTSIGLTAFA